MKRLMVVMFLCALAAPVFAGNVTVSSFNLIEDSANSTTWTIGSSAAKTDFDTSIVYDARYWDNLTLEVKFTPGVASGDADSGAVTVVLQMSNSGTYWIAVDSAVAADSLAFLKNMAPQHYYYARFVAHHGTKLDSAGAAGTIKALARGLK